MSIQEYKMGVEPCGGDRRGPPPVRRGGGGQSHFDTPKKTSKKTGKKKNIAERPKTVTIKITIMN